MSCRPWERLASEALEGALAPGESRALAAHLALCRACAERQEELRDLRALLATDGPAATLEMPVALEREIFRRVEADRSGAIGRIVRALLARLPRRSLVPSTATATALLVVALVGVFRPDADAPITPPPPPDPRVLEAPVVVPEASLLTVWDSSAERIVTTFDLTGLAGRDAVERAGCPHPVPAVYGTAMFDRPAAEVRIFLYEKIVVRG